MFPKKLYPGGIHLKDNKGLTDLKQIEEATYPSQVAIPLLQHAGAACKPLVKIGDKVKIGQKIGDSSQLISAPIHASISGTVTAVNDSIVIESDEKKELFEGIKPPDSDWVKAIREAGIAGLGGAAFPTHIKLSPPKEKKVGTLIINGAECEPYLTCDHRIMLEEAYLVAFGIEAAKKMLKAEKVYLAIEVNKQNAIKLFREKVAGIELIELEAKYPQGSEKQLIKTLTGREVPTGGLPFDVGVVVLNVGTCAQIARTIKTGMPMVDRVVTVTGRHLKEPKNLRVRIGTQFRELIEQCGGVTKGKIKKVLAGGPMTGVSVPSLDVPVVKGTSGIVVMTEEEIDASEPEYCIRCARCVDACPQSLLPNYLGDYSQHDKLEKAEKLGVFDCIECGVCAYVCPSKINLVQLIRSAKTKILKKRKK